MLNKITELAARLKAKKRFIKFCIVGAGNTVLDFTVLTLLVELGRWPVLYANVGSFSCAFVSAYLFNKHWTFRDTGKNHLEQAATFLVISLIGLGLNSLLLWLMMLTGAHYLIGKVGATGVVLFWNYFANRHFTFKNRAV